MRHQIVKHAASLRVGRTSFAYGAGLSRRRGLRLLFSLLYVPTGGVEGRTLTTAEWIKSLFAKGMVYTRLFDEKLGVSQTAKSVAAKVTVSVVMRCVLVWWFHCALHLVWRLWCEQISSLLRGHGGPACGCQARIRCESSLRCFCHFYGKDKRRPKPTCTIRERCREFRKQTKETPRAVEEVVDHADSLSTPCSAFCSSALFRL